MEVDLLLQQGEKTWGEEGSERSSVLLPITGAQGWGGTVNEDLDLVPVSNISSEGQWEGRGWGKMLESL